MRRSLSFRVLLLLAIVGLSLTVVAQSLTPAQTSAIDAAAAEMMKANNVPGISIAIGANGKIIFSKGYGMADLEAQLPVTPRTRFRTASIAKPLTATATMQLVESGKLKLDDPVQQYCPDFPKKQWTVTTRQLLSHRAGVRHYTTEAEAVNTKHYASLKDSITGIFGNDQLLFEPGSKRGYSTYGYVVIGCAIEGASGTSYVNYMASRVFEPAGMSDTTVDNPVAIVPNRVRFYERTAGTIVNSQYFDSSDRIPGGGFVSTPEDLVRFAFALQAGKLIRADSLQLMWTPAPAPASEKNTYGLGWNITANPDGRKIIFHGGGQIGTSTILTIAPEDHMAYAIMTNVQGQNLGKLSEAIEKTVFPAKALAAPAK